MPIARPHDARSNFAQPRNQFTSGQKLWGQFSSDHIPAAAQGMWGPMAEMENMMGQVATHSTPGNGKKQVWNDLDGHYQFTPQGKDGSGMEHINLSQKKVEIVPDPVKGTTISMSTSSMKSSSQGVQSLFPNFGGPRAGSNEALPYHAIDTSKMSANMDPIVSVHNKFTPAPKKPTAQNFHVSFSSGTPKKPPSQTKSKVHLVEIDDDSPQEVKNPVPSKPRQQKLKITEQKPTMSSSTQLENQDSNESHIK
ncbi:hypothetical protein DFH28DRAFT_394986 [Melampsora americana]|nr:hypothetical protein DFH28DRAFT_394986 [Melampsora americana]